jgi:hypothetical protein
MGKPVAKHVGVESLYPGSLAAPLEHLSDPARRERTLLADP